ncbi:MAG: transposase [Erysipelotrichaceae bacterium]|nr:transposase [Erysipelotrichaceae bacterium]
MKNLSVRSWVCPECGSVHDRDENAAKNILAKALSMQTA